MIQFGSKICDEKDLRSRQTEIISHLQQHELMFFAPKARVAQADTQAPQAPQGPPFVSFPFMKLPLELRTMVYKMHFAQPPEPHFVMAPELKPLGCRLHTDPFRRCAFRTINGGVPVRVLWTLSKDIYHEAMSLYFQATYFMFKSLKSLAHFLKVIGPYHRQHVTSVSLENPKFDSSKPGVISLSDDEIHTGLQGLKLLRECPALRHMKFDLPVTKSHLAEDSELFRAMLKIRGLTTVEIYGYWEREVFKDINPFKIHLRHTDIRQVMKQPYRPAVIQKREEKGISCVVVPRTFFGPIDESEVREWFDARESEAIRRGTEESEWADTELKYLRQERKLVEASFRHPQGEQN